MKPKLKSSIEIIPWGDNFLLTNPVNRHTMLVLQQERPIFDLLDGQHSLKDLESLYNQSGRLLYILQQLVMRECFEDNRTTQSFLFPKMLHQIHQERLSLIQNTLFQGQIAMAFKLQHPQKILLLQLGLFLGGLGTVLLGLVSFEVNPLHLNGDWFVGTWLIYLSVSITLSIKAFIQTRFMAQFSQSIPLNLQHFFGILHLDTLRNNMFHTPTVTQQMYSILGIGTMISMMGVYWLLDWMIPNWGFSNMSTGTLLLLVWNLCPFYNTDGAQLLETLTIHKQRHRTHDFIHKQLLRSSFQSDIEGQHQLRTQSLVWLLWFAVAIHLLGQYLLPNINMIFIQAFSYNALLPKIWLGFVSFLLTFYYGYFVIKGIFLTSALVKQLLPSTQDIKSSIISFDEVKDVLSVFELFQSDVESVPKIEYGGAQTILQIKQTPGDMLFLLEGDVQFVQPKPEGGHHIIYGQTAPTPISLHCLNKSPSHYEIYCAAPCTILSLPKPNHPSILQRLHTISHNPYFQKLNGDLLLLLTTHSLLHHYQAGDKVLCKGDPASSLHILVAGTCTILGSEKIHMTPNTIFGEIGILSEAPRNATVVAVDDIQTVEIPAHLIRTCLALSPDFSKVLHALQQSRLEP